MQYYLQEYQEARKTIPQEHQRHKLATIPTITPTTTSTTTPAMTQLGQHQCVALCKVLESHYISCQKVFFCRNKIKKIKKIIIKKRKKMIQNKKKHKKKKRKRKNNVKVIEDLNYKQKKIKDLI